MLYFIACSNSESSLLSLVVNLHCTHTCRFGSHIYFQFFPISVSPSLLDVDPHFVQWRSWDKSRQPLLFTPFTLLVQWSKDDPSQAFQPEKTVGCVYWRAWLARGIAFRNYFMFYVEGTNYLDHLLFQRGKSKWKLWPFEFSLFHLYSEETEANWLKHQLFYLCLYAWYRQR